MFLCRWESTYEMVKVEQYVRFWAASLVAEGPEFRREVPNSQGSSHLGNRG